MIGGDILGKIKNPNLIRICKVCGREYHPASSRQRCCNLPIDRTCPICGKTFQVLCKPVNRNKTCSKACADELIIRNRTSSAAKLIKICKACGKPFTPKTIMDVYCSNPHYRTCDVCGKEYEYDPKRWDIKKTCSEECRYKLMLDGRDFELEHIHQVQTLMNRYNVDNSAKIPGNRSKTILTNNMKYGKDWYTQTDEYKKRIEQTDLIKYGVKHHLSSREVITKRETTLLNTRGVKNVFQLPEVKRKSRNTLLHNIGYENASQIPDSWDKIINTNLVRYGRRVYSQKNITDLDNWYKFIDDPESYIVSAYDIPPTSQEIARHFNANHRYVRQILRKHNAIHCVRSVKSSMEDTFLDSLHSICPNLKIISNNKSAIYPLELDIYIPDLKFAIECNPTFTHNSSFYGKCGTPPKLSDYHYNKTFMCENKGISLFHVFGYDWTRNSDVVLSKIYEYIGKSPMQISSSSCDIREVSRKVARKFLVENSLHGNHRSNIRLGLYSEDELVLLMTFYKLSDGSWVLQDFCSEIYTYVIDGYISVLTYFRSIYNPTTIVTTSDRSTDSNQLYIDLGFSAISKSYPKYIWVNTKTDRVITREMISGSGYKKLLIDSTIDISKSEEIIMMEHNFAKVYDSGTITWEWKSE